MSLNEAAAFLLERPAFFIVSHVSPDGDTLGSALALQKAMTALGKRARVACDAPFPAAYRCLPGNEEVQSSGAIPSDEEAIVYVDVSAIDRAGCFADYADRSAGSLCIDHHVTNPAFTGKGFASVNYVEDCAAAGELMTLLIDELGIQFTPEIASCLYAAISTDTGNFAYSSVNERTFALAGRLMRTGFDLPAMNRALFRSEPARKVRLNALAVSKAEILANGTIALTAISAADMAACGATGEDCDGIVDTLRDIDTVRFSCMLREDNGIVKASLRSKDAGDVASVARKYNGGGHTQAAGCTLHMSLEEAANCMRMELEALA